MAYISKRDIPDPEPWDSPALALGWFAAQARHDSTCNIHTLATPGTGCTCAFGKCYAKVLAAIREHYRIEKTIGDRRIVVESATIDEAIRLMDHATHR